MPNWRHGTMRPPILPDTSLGSLSSERLASLGLRCHIYLRTMNTGGEFARHLAPWRTLFENETRDRGCEDGAALPVLVRRTEDMHELDRTEPGMDLAWLLAAYSVRSGANPD